jgi:hypothetical protein
MQFERLTAGTSVRWSNLLGCDGRLPGAAMVGYVNVHGEQDFSSEEASVVVHAIECPPFRKGRERMGHPQFG